MSTTTFTGQIVDMHFVRGVENVTDCEVEGCECACHDREPRTDGTYVTVKLDGIPRLRFWRVTMVEVEE